MRIGAYIDGFNLYYGGKSHQGSLPGWKWLDLRALTTWYSRWTGSQVTRVVYCTARVNDPGDPGQMERQDFYLRALQKSGSVDVIEEGRYVSWANEQVMTSDPVGTRAPSVLTDVLAGAVDGAIVISNDSDLALPIRVARRHVPVGVINPQRSKPLAGALKGSPEDGVGRHWWRRLDAEALTQCQLPDEIGAVRKPQWW